jgi:hypothetical protein
MYFFENICLNVPFNKLINSFKAFILRFFCFVVDIIKALMSSESILLIKLWSNSVSLKKRL